MVLLSTLVNTIKTSYLEQCFNVYGFLVDCWPSSLKPKDVLNVALILGACAFLTELGYLDSGLRLGLQL